MNVYELNKLNEPNSDTLYIDTDNKIIEKTQTEKICYSEKSVCIYCFCWKLDNKLYYNTRHQDFLKVPEPEPLYCCIPMCICFCCFPVCSCVCFPKLMYRHVNYMYTPICNYCDSLLDCAQVIIAITECCYVLAECCRCISIFAN